MILGNWKMNLAAGQAITLARQLKRACAGREGLPGIGVCPSPLHLMPVCEELQGSPVRVGAQDLVAQELGAFTGGVAAEQLREIGVRFTLVGHSERRQHFHESDEEVAAKVKAAQRAGLQPVVCFGETLQERESGETERVVLRQVEAALADQTPSRVSALVLAYEPVWAIGTGRNADVRDARQVHGLVRHWVQDRFGAEVGVPILYGGSVKPQNVAQYLAAPEIDGALVGGASLAADSFLAIVEAAVGGSRSV